MKINLLFTDKDTPGSYIYPDAQNIVRDLNLNLVFEQASRDTGDGTTGFAGKPSEKDEFIKEAMRKVMLTPVLCKEELEHRQKLIMGFAENEKLIIGLYDVALRAEKTISEHFQGADKLSKGGISTIEKVKYLNSLVDYLGEIAALLEAQPLVPAIEKVFEEFQREFNREFREATDEILEDLEFLTSGGRLVVSADNLGGLKAERFYVSDLELTEFKQRKKPKTGTFAKVMAAANSIINPDVKELKEETLIADAKALENSACDYILSFYEVFMKESGAMLKNLKLSSAFYLGAVRLYKRFKRFSVPVCFPKVCDRKDIRFKDLCETCLCIYQRRRPVGNDIDGSGKQVFVVTGANQGGKSTYLRSIGLAQVFMQAGMFVTALEYESGLYKNIFAHFTRREDSTMNSGRLDEELKRMSQIADRLTPDSMLLLNESFATTTEKEGSIIADELTDAILKTGIRMFSVTHLLEYAHSCFDKSDERVLFLSAERRSDGSRSFKIKVNAPENTSYGLDLYDAIIK